MIIVRVGLRSIAYRFSRIESEARSDKPADGMRGCKSNE